ncbi:MAG: tetratricopeptide repeat protein [Thermodesulfobacteriota bacterium]
MKAALADYTKAIEINPNYADSFINRGYAKPIQHYEGALKDFDKAIELRSRSRR